MNTDPSPYFGPFGPADRVQTLSTAIVAAMYMTKCNVDVSPHLHGHEEIELFRCRETGMLFWRPEEIAGSEQFYQELSVAWSSYYKDWRWEYDLLEEYLVPGVRLLEIGSGRGFFLRHTEGKVEDAKGLELNNEAIASKVTSWDIVPSMVGSVARSEPESRDLVCSFQVLEHVTDPSGFIADCLACLKPGGRLALSVPNYENVSFQRREDAFDLPPHHVNHFTVASFRKIAKIFGVTIERVETEPRQFRLEPATKNVSRQFAYRIAKKIAVRAFQSIYDRHKEPGHTMMVILRKA